MPDADAILGLPGAGCAERILELEAEHGASECPYGDRFIPQHERDRAISKLARLQY